MQNNTSIPPIVCLYMLQVLAASYHILCWHFSEEEAILQELCQHCNLWSVGHLHCFCSHSMCAVCFLQASQCPQLLGRKCTDSVHGRVACKFVCTWRSVSQQYEFSVGNYASAVNIAKTAPLAWGCSCTHGTVAELLAGVHSQHRHDF